MIRLSLNWNEGRWQLKILAHSCHSELHPDLTGSFIDLPEVILTEVNLEKEKLSIISKDQISSMNRTNCNSYPGSRIQSITFVPLQLREQVLGFLGLEMHEEERTITDEEIEPDRNFFHGYRPIDREFAPVSSRRSADHVRKSAIAWRASCTTR